MCAPDRALASAHNLILGFQDGRTGMPAAGAVGVVVGYADNSEWPLSTAAARRPIWSWRPTRSSISMKAGACGGAGGPSPPVRRADVTAKAAITS